MSCFSQHFSSQLWNMPTASIPVLAHIISTLPNVTSISVSHFLRAVRAPVNILLDVFTALASNQSVHTFIMSYNGFQMPDSLFELLSSNYSLRYIDLHTDDDSLIKLTTRNTYLHEQQRFKSIKAAPPSSN